MGKVKSEKPAKIIVVIMDETFSDSKIIWESYFGIRKIITDPKTETSTIFTHNTDFFCFDTLEYGWNVLVLDKTGSIDLYDLLHVPGKYCAKQIRKAHNVRKLLMAGALKFHPSCFTINTTLHYTENLGTRVQERDSKLDVPKPPPSANIT